MSDRPVLLAFDGSDPARRAIEQAGALFPGRRAVVTTVWRSIESGAAAARVALPDAVVDDAVERLDAAAGESALEIAREGAELATAAGMQATPDARVCADAVWSTVLAAADEIDAAAIVVGSRGRSAVQAALLGSTSSGVLHRSRRPVVLVGDPG